LQTHDLLFSIDNISQVFCLVLNQALSLITCQCKSGPTNSVEGQVQYITMKAG